MTAYVVGVGFFLLVWACMYVLVPRIRWYMLCTSLSITHFGPFLQYWYLRDYWNPGYTWYTSIAGIPLAVEDGILGFGLTGVAAGFFGLVMPKAPSPAMRRSMLQTWLRVQASFLIFVFALALLTARFGVNSVHATFVACFIGSICVFARRPQWLGAGVAAGVAMAVLFFFFYEAFYLQLYPSVLEDWWQQSALSGLKLRRVPVEELVWGFATGLFVGPLVRMCAEVPAPKTMRAFAERAGQTAGGE